MANFLTIEGGHKMPTVGLGTFTITDEEELEKALDVALEIGYRHIDTAYLYKNEHTIGKVLKKWIDSGKIKREDLFITTKLPPTGNHADKVEWFLKASLENLQMDYVDLYLVHFPVAMEFTEILKFPGEPVKTDHIELWKKLEEQVDAGRAKAIGISNFNLRQTKRIFESARIKPACNQFELHPYLQQKELVKYCQQNNIIVTGYGSLGRTGVNDYYEKIGRPKVVLPALLEDELLKKIGSKYGKTAAQVILRYFVQNNIIMIPKSVTPERIKQNFDIFDFSLDSEDLKMIESLDKGEEGRIGRFTDTEKLTSHPEFPF